MISDLKKSIAVTFKKECDHQYDKLFLKELEKLCLVKSLVKERQRRELFTAVTILIIATMTSVGIGTGAYAIYKTDQLEISQLNMERTLDDLKTKATITSEELAFFYTEMNKMATTLMLSRVSVIFNGYMGIFASLRQIRTEEEFINRCIS